MEFKYRQQVAVYKSLRKIDTSYKNSSTLRFDNTLRMFVNRLRKMESFDGKQLLSVFCLWHILALSDTRNLKPSTFIQEFVINHWHALKKRLSQSRIWNGLYISPPPLAHHIVHILKGNFLHDVFRLKLSSSDLDKRLESKLIQFLANSTTDDTKIGLQRIIDKFVQSGSIEETMVLIHDLKRPLLLEKKCASRLYRALDAVETMLKFIGNYSNNDSEATVLRRLMTVLSSVFSNISRIKLIEGETTSSCTKPIRLLHVAFYDANQSQSIGPKIDILVKHDQGSSKLIELSTLEVKPANAGPAVIKEQQNKNLLKMSGLNNIVISEIEDSPVEISSPKASVVPVEEQSVLPELDSNEPIWRWKNITKSIRRLNVALYDVNQSQSIGRKIDILVKHDQGSNKFIELSSLEVKPANAGPAVIKEQQNKNLRTNGAILAYLSSLNPKCCALQTTAAIDFIGSVGYVYTMTNIEDIFYAKQVGIMMLPKSRSTFTNLIETMDLLFAFEAFMINLGHEARAALEHRESLDNICEVANVFQKFNPSPVHDIFITPTRHK
ncbi:unnamed protein product [Mucor hiemalis]